MRGRVDEAEARLHAQTQLVGLGIDERGQRADPQLDIGTLQTPHLGVIAGIELRDIPVVHADHVGVTECEVHVEGDERAHPLFRRCALGGHAGSAGDEVVAHLDENRPEQRLLSREVAVHSGAGHAHGGSDVLETHTVVPAVGEESRGLAEDRVGALCLGAISRGDGACHLS